MVRLVVLVAFVAFVVLVVLVAVVVVVTCYRAVVGVGGVRELELAMMWKSDSIFNNFRTNNEQHIPDDEVFGQQRGGSEHQFIFWKPQQMIQIVQTNSGKIFKNEIRKCTRIPTDLADEFR